MESLRCSVCSASADVDEREKVFADVDSLWSHIAMVHLFWLPYECILCPMTCMPTDAVLKHHYQQTHPGKVPKAIYTYEEGKKAEFGRIVTASQALTMYDSTITPELNQPSTLILRSYEERYNSRPHRSHQDTFIQEDPPVDTEMIPELDHFPPNSDSPTDRSPSPDQLSHDLDVKQVTEQAEITRGIVIEEQSPSPPLLKSERNMKSETIHQRKMTVRRTVKPTRIVGSIQPIEKSACQLCRKLVRTTARGDHCWSHHVVGHRFKCNQCAHETKFVINMRRHAEFHHQRAANGVWWTDKKRQMWPEYKAVYTAAFGSYLEARETNKWNRNKPEGPKTKATSTGCRLCGTTEPLYNRNHHIWRYHMQQKRYECDLCDYRSIGWLTEIVRHARRRHGIVNKICWTDRAKSLSVELAAAYKAAFSDGFEMKTVKEEGNWVKMESDNVEIV